MNPYYPAFIDLRKKSCVVIGGGKVAIRKINSLIKAKANITVISPEGDYLEELEKKQLIEWKRRTYQIGDIEGYFLVIIATNNCKLNMEIYKEIDPSIQMVNIVDSPNLCTFIVPSSFNRGHLQIAISTHGASPGLSKKIRQDLEIKYGEEYIDYTFFLAEMRKWVFEQNIDEKKRRRFFNCLLEEKWFDEIHSKGIEKAKADFKAIFKKEINHIE